MIGARRKGRSSERIAERLLRKLGYQILERNKIIERGGENAFEIDFISLNPEGERCCVEVKAGHASVSDIRQTYANSEMTDCKPIIVCKEPSKPSAEAVAEELGVEIIPFRDYYLTELEELEIAVQSAVQEVLVQFGFYPLPSQSAFTEERKQLLKTLAETESFAVAAKKLDLSKGELGDQFGALREDGFLPQWSQSFDDLKRFSRHVLHRYSRIESINQINEKLDQLLEEMAKLREKKSC